MSHQLPNTSKPYSQNRIQMRCKKYNHKNIVCKYMMQVGRHRNLRYIVNSWKLCFNSTNSYCCILNICSNLYCQQNILTCIQYKLNCCCISNSCSLKLLLIIDKVCMCLKLYQGSTHLSMIRKWQLNCRRYNLLRILSIFHKVWNCSVHSQVHKLCINYEDCTWNNPP